MARSRDQKRFRTNATGLPPAGSLQGLSSSAVRQPTFSPLPCESAALKRVCHTVTDPFFFSFFGVCVCGNDCSLFRKVRGTYGTLKLHMPGLWCCKLGDFTVKPHTLLRGQGSSCFTFFSTLFCVMLLSSAFNGKPVRGCLWLFCASQSLRVTCSVLCPYLFFREPGCELQQTEAGVWCSSSIRPAFSVCPKDKVRRFVCVCASLRHCLCVYDCMLLSTAANNGLWSKVHYISFLLLWARCVPADHYWFLLFCVISWNLCWKPVCPHSKCWSPCCWTCSLLMPAPPWKIFEPRFILFPSFGKHKSLRVGSTRATLARNDFCLLHLLQKTLQSNW